MDSKTLEKRLASVKDSAEDIQSLSKWCIQHKNHYHAIVQAWSKAIRKGMIPNLFTFLYVDSKLFFLFWFVEYNEDRH